MRRTATIGAPLRDLTNVTRQGALLTHRADSRANVGSRGAANSGAPDVLHASTQLAALVPSAPGTVAQPPPALVPCEVPSLAAVGNSCQPYDDLSADVHMLDEHVQQQDEGAPAQAQRPAERKSKAAGSGRHDTSQSSTGSGSSTAAYGDTPQDLAALVPELHLKLLRDETLFLADPNYMSTQADLNPRMRAILVDWLVEVHMRYRLRPETLFLTVNLIDRYLSRAAVARQQLQLVGVVAMLIAAKFEEIHPPEVQDFVFITANSYTRDEVLQMECTMLTAVNLELVVPTPAHFLDFLLVGAHCTRSEEVRRHLTAYIMELALLDTSMMVHTPSTVVASALLLSNELLGHLPAWPASLAQRARKTEAVIRNSAEQLRGLLAAAPRSPLQAVRNKYSHPAFRSVATLACAESPNLPAQGAGSALPAS